MPEFLNSTGTSIFSYDKMLEIEVLGKTYYTGCKLLKPFHCTSDKGYNYNGILVIKSGQEFDFIEKKGNDWFMTNRINNGSLITYKTNDDVLNHIF